MALRCYCTDRKLTHTDTGGKARMVDVGAKAVTSRTASAEAVIRVGAEIAQLIRENTVKKGDVLSVAKLAAIMAAKKTSELIPLCHNIVLDNVHVEAELLGETVVIRGEVKCTGRTGVEMEALTCVTVGALTIYDMCKAVSHEMVIEEVKLVSKTGGARGDFRK